MFDESCVCIAGFRLVLGFRVSFLGDELFCMSFTMLNNLVPPINSIGFFSAKIEESRVNPPQQMITALEAFSAVNTPNISLMTATPMFFRTPLLTLH